MKSPKSSSTQQPRAGQAQMAQASSKNKRLAEQMSRRTGLDDSQSVPAADVKSRLGALPTKSRLGPVPREGRGRGLRGGSSMASRTGPSRWSSQRGGARGRGGGGSRGGNRGNRRNLLIRGRGRGRGGRGGGRGRGGRGGAMPSKVSREALDNELDSYMNVGKKDDASW